MQDRIRRFVEDRTRMIAAISHDLRTPITRMRLRAELIGESEQQQKMLADLAEMETMIASTLSFAREDANPEPRRAYRSRRIAAGCLRRHPAGQAGSEPPSTPVLDRRPAGGLAPRLHQSDRQCGALRRRGADRLRRRRSQHRRHDRRQRAWHPGRAARSGLQAVLPAGFVAQPRHRRHRAWTWPWPEPSSAPMAAMSCCRTGTGPDCGRP